MIRHASRIPLVRYSLAASLRRAPVALALGVTAVGASLTLAYPAAAALELPAPSPLAKVSQRVGLTDIEVEYSSPGVKDRKIWDGLVPYGELWRTGANAATKVTFSEDVTVAGTPVRAGTYAIFTIPAAKKWTFILNEDADQGGTRNYDKAKDVLRTEVVPEAIPHRERMTFVFADFDDNGAKLALEWEKLRVAVPITVHTAEQAEANIEGALGEGARNYANSARYLLDNDLDAERALDLAMKAEMLDGSWFNKFILARALAANERWSDAVAKAKASYALGEKADYFFWRDLVAQSIEDWQAKAGN